MNTLNFNPMTVIARNNWKWIQTSVTKSWTNPGISIWSLRKSNLPLLHCCSTPYAFRSGNSSRISTRCNVIVSMTNLKMLVVKRHSNQKITLNKTLNNIYNIIPVQHVPFSNLMTCLTFTAKRLFIHKQSLASHGRPYFKPFKLCALSPVQRSLLQWAGNTYVTQM